MAEGPKKDLILHQFGRAKTLPSASPYCLKLETFIRMAEIPYENDFRNPQGPYGKAPWMTYKGQAVTDSTLCIEFLCEKLNLNVDSHLSDEQKAIGRSLVLMGEDNLMWVFALFRWVYDETKSIGRIMPWGSFPPFSVIHFFIKRSFNKRAIGHGIGQHPKETIMAFGKKDVKALSDFLGTKKFFFGDQPSSYDCALFAMLAQLVWGAPGSPFESWVNEEYSNLKTYCNNMKDKFWSDWDEILSK